MALFSPLKENIAAGDTDHAGIHNTTNAAINKLANLPFTDSTGFTTATQALIDSALAPVLALIGPASDTDTVVNTLREVLTVMSNFPEGVNLLTRLAGIDTAISTNTTAITNGLASKVDVVSGKGLSTNDFTATLLTKLNGVATGATVNSTDAQLRDRSTHTGTQSADSIVDGSTNKVYTNTEKLKLGGIQSGATANDTDVNLKNRANHTGSQPSSTISDLAAVIATAITNALATDQAAVGINMDAASFTGNGSTTNFAINPVYLDQFSFAKSGSNLVVTYPSGKVVNVALT